MSYATSLFSDVALGPPTRVSSTSPAPATSLLDLLYEGFFVLFLLKRGHEPDSATHFNQHIRQFLSDFELGAKKLHASADDIFMAKFAFCAAIDEAVLASTFAIRGEWERHPLQLVLFGEQLAGEKFFQHLEDGRAQGASRIASLEVFHMCLLLGFQGKYLLEGPEKLAYLTARVGDEIAARKGKRAAFAPHWALPDRIEHALKRETPLWAIGGVFLLIGVIAFTGLRHHLRDSTLNAMAPYTDLIKVGPHQANLTITLP